MPTDQWSSGKQTTLLPFLRYLLKENMWSSVLFQGKWKHTPAEVQRRAEESGMLWLRVSFLLLCSTFLHCTPPHGAGVSGLTPPYSDQAGASLPGHTYRKINQYSGQVTGMPPLNIRPLIPAGFSLEKCDRDLSVLSVCSVSDTNKVLVLRGGAWLDPARLRHNKSNWGVQGGLTCIRPRLWKHCYKFFTPQCP